MKSIKLVTAALCLGIMAAGASSVLHARDRGINQPGEVGNHGPADAGRDPGINQPGAAGNVHRDPGVNQPGAAGNREGARR